MKHTDKNYKAIISNTRVTQVYVVPFEKQNRAKHDFIHRVVIGPTANSNLVADTLQILAKKEDFEWVECDSSNIPFRGS